MKPKILEDLVVDEVSLVDVPANKGARVILMKRGEPTDGNSAEAAQEDELTEDEIKKCLERDPLLKFQAERGAVRKVAAELELEKKARALHEQGICKSYADAYCRALNLHPALAELAVGATTEVK